MNTTVIQPTPAKPATLSTKGMQQHLQETGLRISAVHANGRYLCRAKNADGKNIAAASSKSLVDALVNIIEKTEQKQGRVAV